ncbi:MAG: TetR/AcrR family transcriptional regulator [Chloroflexota bacterium]
MTKTGEADTSGQPNPANGRRERLAAERLERILEAAAALFAEQGFHRTTTREIAEAADVSEGTLYNYFDNKNDLLFSILERLGEYELPSDWASSPLSSEARQFLTQMLQLRRAFVDENAVMLQAIISEVLANAELRRRYNRQMLGPTLEALETNLRQRAGLGQIDACADLPAAARVIVSLYIGSFILQVLGDPLVKNEWDRLMETFLMMVFDGIAPKGGADPA